MNENLSVLEERIDEKRKQLLFIASDHSESLTSRIVLEKSRELDVLINEFLKLKAEEEASDMEKDIEALEISYEFDQESKATIFLKGCLDISTTRTMSEATEKIKDAEHIIIDFTNLSFIDSTGIGALLDIIYESRQNNKRIEFYGLKGYIEEIFETVGIIRVLEAVQRKG